MQASRGIRRRAELRKSERRGKQDVGLCSAALRARMARLPKCRSRSENMRNANKRIAYAAVRV